MPPTWTIAAICTALCLAGCGPPTGEQAAQAPVTAADGIRVAGFSGILARTAILFQRADNSLTQCFVAEGQLSHCTNIPDPHAAVVGYVATGSDQGRSDGDEAVILLQASDGSLRQCALVGSALSPCTDVPAVQGRIVGYHYFEDASAILFEEPDDVFTHCWIEAGRLSNCESGRTTPGRVLAFNQAGEEEAVVLFARSDGELADCSLYGGRLHSCSTVAAPFANVIGYYWRYHEADILATREDGSLVQCTVARGADPVCTDIPPPP